MYVLAQNHAVSKMLQELAFKAGWKYCGTDVGDKKVRNFHNECKDGEVVVLHLSDGYKDFEILNYSKDDLPTCVSLDKVVQLLTKPAVPELFIGPHEVEVAKNKKSLTIGCQTVKVEEVDAVYKKFFG